MEGRRKGERVGGVRWMATPKQRGRFMVRESGTGKADRERGLWDEPQDRMGSCNIVIANNGRHPPLERRCVDAPWFPLRAGEPTPVSSSRQSSNGPKANLHSSRRGRTIKRSLFPSALRQHTTHSKWALYVLPMRFGEFWTSLGAIENDRYL